DVNPLCEPVALSLNATPAAEGRFAFRHHDILALDYAALPPGLGRPALIVNTSCEHLDRFEAWFAGIPRGMLVLLQSNDYRAIPEHVNCVDTLAAFQAQAPLSDVLYAGELRLDKYTRFMLIGRK
ncbi:MAG: class I SAM-dependent methyltransferase, partial [Methyloligellaceae bacterium]